MPSSFTQNSFSIDWPLVWQRFTGVFKGANLLQFVALALLTVLGIALGIAVLVLLFCIPWSLMGLVIWALANFVFAPLFHTAAICFFDAVRIAVVFSVVLWVIRALRSAIAPRAPAPPQAKGR